MVREIRYGLRTLTRNFRLTLLAMTILGLAIGGSAGVFALIDAVFLRPVAGVRAPEQLVRFERVQPGLSATNFSYPDYAAYRDESRAFSGVAAHSMAPMSLSGSITQRIRGDLVTGNYFSVLGVTPVLGRFFDSRNDGAPGANAVVVLSYALWRRAFGSDGEIVGKSIILNGHVFEVVGVAKPNFTGTQVGEQDEVWIPLSMQPWGIPRLSPDILNSRAAGWIDIFARLRAGMRLTHGQADVTTIAERLARDYPVTNAHRRVRLLAGIGMDPDDEQDAGKLLALLMAAVAVLLMTAAANVATLLLARGMGRQHEMAVRIAMGGRPSEIVGQLMAEALLLSGAAGVGGVLFTPWVSRFLDVFRESSPVLRGVHAEWDWRLAVFIFGVAMGTGVLLGLVPAVESAKVDVMSSLKRTSRTATRGRPRRQQLLVTFQLSLSFLLLASTGSMLRTMDRLKSIAPGFEAHHVLLMSLDVGIQGYSEPAGKQFYRDLADRIERLPGVRSVSLSQTVPPQELGSRVSVFHPGQAPPPAMMQGREFELGFRVDANVATPQYFQTLEIPLLSGRDFTQHDDEKSPGVAIVNKALAERMWPGQEAVGKQIVRPTFEASDRLALRVVGVVGNTRQRALSLKPPPVFYVPIAQSYTPAVTLLVRTEGDPMTLRRAVESQIRSLDSRVPVFRIQTLEEHVSDSLWRQRAALAMIGSFGVLSVLIAAIGLYGVLSQWVLQRVREIAIRVALGAKRADVMRLLWRETLTLVWIGSAFGLLGTIAAAFAGRAVSVNLSEYAQPRDAAAIGLAALVLTFVALGSSAIPAARALRVDPGSALHAE